jgi:hypothetical protein
MPKRKDIPGIEELLGVVHPMGAGGGRSGQETTWTGRFSFLEWRAVGGAVKAEELSIFQPGLSDNQLSQLMQAVKPYHVLRLRVRFAEPFGARKQLNAELVEFLGSDTSDIELNSRAQELQLPVTVDHPYFGKLALNRRLNCFEVKLHWKRKPVRLILSRDDCKDEGELFRTAQKLWEEQKDWDKLIRDFACEKLLPLKNDGWLGENEKEFSPTQFKSKMSLNTVAINPGEFFEFTFNDGNLFWGHVIQVSGNFADGPTDADIAG